MDSKIDHFNKTHHKGNFPVRVLSYNFIQDFIKITPDFEMEFNYEVDSNNLPKTVKININKSKITEIAEISKYKGIEVYENFNQFLWSCAYSFIVIYDKAIFEPTKKGEYKGIIDRNIEYVSGAIELFKNALLLFERYDSSVFFKLPNPETYTQSEKYYIERANQVFSSAMVFILLHEFGHKYYGHLEVYSDDDKSIEEEYEADEFAYKKISKNFFKNTITSHKLGIVVGIVSLIFTDNTLKGGNRHPDPDNRLINLIEKMQLDDGDNIWGVASLAFDLWAINNTTSLSKARIFKNTKEMFYAKLNDVKRVKA